MANILRVAAALTIPLIVGTYDFVRGPATARDSSAVVSDIFVIGGTAARHAFAQTLCAEMDRSADGTASAVCAERLLAAETEMILRTSDADNRPSGQPCRSAQFGR